MRPKQLLECPVSSSKQLLFRITCKRALHLSANKDSILTLDSYFALITMFSVFPAMPLSKRDFRRHLVPSLKLALATTTASYKSLKPGQL